MWDAGIDTSNSIQVWTKARIHPAQHWYITCANVLTSLCALGIFYFMSVLSVRIFLPLSEDEMQTKASVPVLCADKMRIS